MRSLIVRDLDGEVVFGLTEDGSITGEEHAVDEILFSIEGAEDPIEAAYSLFSNSSVLVATIEDSVSLSDTEVLLHNPYHDELGRFTTKERDASGKAQVRDVIGIKPHHGKLDLSEEEVREVKKAVDGIHSSMRKEVSGSLSMDIIVTHSMGEYRSEGKIPGIIAPYILGIAHDEGRLYVNPALTEALAGREKPYFKWGILGPAYISGKDIAQVAERTVVHETFHSRKRKYGIPYEPDGVGVDTRKYNLFVEEGCTELLAQTFMYRTKRASLSEISRLGSYPIQVQAMAAEARRRYPNSPSDALSFIARIHRIGFTNQGVRESFGIKHEGNLVLPSGGQGDVLWMLRGADDSVKLEEDKEMVDIWSLLMEGKIDEAMDEFEKNPTLAAAQEISEFLAKYGDDDARKKIAERLGSRADQGDVGQGE